MNKAANLQAHLALYPPSWAEKFGEDDFGVFACFFVGKVEFEFRWIAPGKFMMGTPETELGRFDDEGPQVEQKLAGFWVGTRPVTQAQWLAVMEKNPSHFKGERKPVEGVNWSQARSFAMDLGHKTGTPLYLPREVQWEYACRAETTSALYTGKELTTERAKCPNLDEIAWYDENSDSQTHEVGQKQPNKWGLYDMLGNVWEWCEDVWDEKAYEKCVRAEKSKTGDKNALRVVRGGSWSSYAGFCRAASRNWYHPGDHRKYLGFRLVAGQEPGAAEPP